jgi:anti-anti-sigma factor
MGETDFRGVSSQQPATPFHAWVEPDADPPIVGVAGEIDLETCAAFRFILDDAVSLHSDAIILDFRRLEFLGSVGIREMVRALRDVDRVEIHSPTANVRRVLELSGLDGRLVIVD